MRNALYKFKTYLLTYLLTYSALENCCVYSSVPPEAVTIAILNCASFHSLCGLMIRRVKSFKQAVSLRTICVSSSVFWPHPQPFTHLFIALLMIHCLKSSQKSAGLVYQVATVYYGNHAAGSKPIKTFYCVQLRIKYNVSLYQK